MARMIRVEGVYEILEGDYRFESEQASEYGKNGGISAAIQRLLSDRVDQEFCLFYAFI